MPLFEEPEPVATPEPELKAPPRTRRTRPAPKPEPVEEPEASPDPSEPEEYGRAAVLEADEPFLEPPDDWVSDLVPPPVEAPRYATPEQLVAVRQTLRRVRLPETRWLWALQESFGREFGAVEELTEAEADRVVGEWQGRIYRGADAIPPRGGGA
jgi:hypothetical protein